MKLRNLLVLVFAAAMLSCATTGLNSLSLSDDLTVGGTTTLTGAIAADGGITVDTSNATISGITGAIATASTITKVSGVIGIPLVSGHTWDSLAVNIPATAGNDDMGLVTGTPGTNAPQLQGLDVGGGGSETDAGSVGFQFVVPDWYTTGGTMTLQILAGMLTTVAQTTAKIYVKAWVPDYANKDGTVGVLNNGATGVSINSLTFATVEFLIDDDLAAHVLAPGDVVQLQIQAKVNDTTDAGVMIPCIRDIRVAFST